MHIARKMLAAAIALPVLVSGCVFYPTVTAYQDPECDVQRHQFELKDEPYDGSGCASSGVAGCIGAALLIGPTTFVISGSFVFVGNMTLQVERGGENYWRQMTGRCKAAPATPKPDPLPTGPQTALTSRRNAA